MAAIAEPLCHTLERYYDGSGRIQVQVRDEDAVTEEKHYGSDISRITLNIHEDGEDEKAVTVILKESTLDKMINQAVEDDVHLTSELQVIN